MVDPGVTYVIGMGISGGVSGAGGGGRDLKLMDLPNPSAILEGNPSVSN